MTQLPEIKLLKKKNYLAMIRNAARGENNMFRDLYLTVDGVERDAAGDGSLACAIFVCSVLYLQNSQHNTKLIDFVHASVVSTEKDLAKNGWSQINEPREGAILVWEAVKGQPVPVYGDMHHHIGFSIGNERAISNDGDGRGIPVEHHWTYNGTRNIVRIWWHTALE